MGRISAAEGCTAWTRPRRSPRRDSPNPLSCAKYGIMGERVPTFKFHPLRADVSELLRCRRRLLPVCCFINNYRNGCLVASSSNTISIAGFHSSDAEFQGACVTAIIQKRWGIQSGWKPGKHAKATAAHHRSRGDQGSVLDTTFTGKRLGRDGPRRILLKHGG